MARDGIEIIARAAIRWGALVLACRHEGEGYLYLPGGHVEFDESAEEALRRELREEASLEATVRECVMVCEARFEQGGRRRHELNLVFHVEPSFPPDPTLHPPGPPTTPPTTPPAGGTPPAVRSREPKIGFEWIELASIVDRDFRPRAIKAWLVSGGEGGYSVGGETGTTGALWLSDAE